MRDLFCQVQKDFFSYNLWSTQLDLEKIFSLKSLWLLILTTTFFQKSRQFCGQMVLSEDGNTFVRLFIIKLTCFFYDCSTEYEREREIDRA